MLQRIFSRNNVFFGLAIGLLLPALAFYLLSPLIDFIGTLLVPEKGVYASHFRQRSLAIIAICINLIPMNGFNKNRRPESMRGMMLATIILGIVWFISFKDQLLPE